VKFKKQWRHFTTGFAQRREVEKSSANEKRRATQKEVRGSKRFLLVSVFLRLLTFL
jgi:hypothetical protein